MPESDASHASDRRVLPGFRPRAWVYVAIAFALGVGLFLLIWARQRGNDDFYRPDTTRTGTSGQQFEPLPQPGTEDSDLAPPAEAPAGADDPAAARIAETAPAPPPLSPPAPEPAAAPPPTSGAVDSPPVVVSNPAPTYPRAALRRRESGTVVLRVRVDPGGVPADVSLVQGSGSRYLDRAASEAVRRWRFRPAMRDGRPVSGEVQVPIAFQPAR